MASAWSGSVAELLAKHAQGALVEEIRKGVEALYGPPSPSEAASWAPAMDALTTVLGGGAFDTVQVLLEFQMPVGGFRADVVLLGGSPQSPRTFVLEDKSWEKVQTRPGSYQVVLNGEIHRHPMLQVLTYEGKLRLFSSVASSHDLKSAVFLPKMAHDQITKMTEAAPADLRDKVRAYGKGQGAALTDALRAHLLPNSMGPAERKAFDAAAFQNSVLLLQLLEKHGEDIQNNVLTALAEAGLALTPQQDAVAAEVLEALQEEKKAAFVVQGGPGSGKTLLAISLYLRASKIGKSTVLALRNNRLKAILDQSFDEEIQGSSGTIAFFDPQPPAHGVGQKHWKAIFDLMILDEAQRMEQKVMETAMARARVSVVFLDEGQRLNPPEGGTVEAFSAAATAVGTPPTQRSLTSLIRCWGGQPYHDWLEALLTGPSHDASLKAKKQPWNDRYLFSVAPDITAFLTKMSTLRDSGGSIKAAMVASFTESPGSQGSVKAPENVRIGFPLTSGFELYKDAAIELRWLMKPAEYVNFWMKGGSNQLKRLASIYGSQGFEADYVGVVWGRDLLYRGGAWQLGDPNHCYDTIDRLVTGTKQHKWATDALTFVKNRYRIFLTRGIRGTIVFAEDEATRAQLMKVAAE